MSTGIVILAAGESARMGEPKQLLSYRGTTLLQHTIATALAISGAPVVVVLGAHAAQIRAQFSEARASFVENPDWREGMGGSLRVGLSALLAAHPAISSAVFLTCDQPLLSAEMLVRLIDTQARTGRAIAAAEYDDTLGVPAVFARELFPALLALSGREGARHLIARHRDSTIGVPFPEGAADIDTPSDYARLRRLHDELSTPLPV